MRINLKYYYKNSKAPEQVKRLIVENNKVLSGKNLQATVLDVIIH
jgi:hypothetical protein